MNLLGLSFILHLWFTTLAYSRPHNIQKRSRPQIVDSTIRIYLERADHQNPVRGCDARYWREQTGLLLCLSHQLAGDRPPSVTSTPTQAARHRTTMLLNFNYFITFLRKTNAHRYFLYLQKSTIFNIYQISHIQATENPIPNGFYPQSVQEYGSHSTSWMGNWTTMSMRDQHIDNWWTFITTEQLVFITEISWIFGSRVLLGRYIAIGWPFMGTHNLFRLE